MDASPYAPPIAVVDDLPPADLSAAEQLRGEHLRHEVQLKSVGMLYYFSGSMLLLSGLVMLINPEFQSGNRLSVITMATFYAALVFVILAIGYGLRRLQHWVLIPGSILSAIGLLGFPVGTMINGWILYLLLSDKGRTILSQTYQKVIADTPHLKYRRSTGDWIALGLLIAILLGVAVLIVVGMGS